MSGRYITLMYHRVVDVVKDDVFNMCVSAPNFREHMGVLTLSGGSTATGRFHPAALPDAHGLGRIEVTFDDGYEDNYTCALPILTEYQVPATFFLCVNNIISGEPLWYEKIRMLRGAGLKWLNEIINDQCSRHPTTTDLPKVVSSLPSSPATWECQLNNIVDELKTIDPARRDRFIGAAIGKADSARDSVIRNLPRMMTPAQVRALSRQMNIKIGSHGLSHSRFSILTVEQQYAEMRQSRLLLEEMTGREIDQFAFPFGRPIKDYGAASLRQARRAGYTTCYSTVPSRRFLFRSRDAHPRFEVKDWTREEFINRLDDWLTMS